MIERHHGMDWLRIGAFGLLIFYHIGMFFVHWPWHVKTANPVEVAAVPMLALSAWRLPLLFVVSGFASAALLRRSPDYSAFLRNRSTRLLLPLLFGMIFIVPPQPWAELSTLHGYRDGLLHFWSNDYFRFGAIEGIDLPTWQHLWFVAYVWVYTMVAVAVAALLPAALADRLRRHMDCLLGGVRLFLLRSRS